MKRVLKVSGVEEFWNAPDEALFDQKVFSQVLGLSEKWFERRRWLGDGIRYLKLSSRIKYRKSDVIAWLQQHKAVESTTQYQQEAQK